MLEKDHFWVLRFAVLKRTPNIYFSVSFSMNMRPHLILGVGIMHLKGLKFRLHLLEAEMSLCLSCTVKTINPDELTDEQTYGHANAYTEDTQLCQRS